MTDNTYDADDPVYGLSTADGDQRANLTVGSPVGASVEEESPHKADQKVGQHREPGPPEAPDPPNVPPGLRGESAGRPDGFASGNVGPSDVLDAPGTTTQASVAASRQRSNANLRPGDAAGTARARAAKRQRDSAVLTREELAGMLSRVLRDSRTKAPYFAQIARVLSDLMGYSKGPPLEDTKPQLADLDAFIDELQPDDPEESPDSPESEAGDPPIAKPESSND